MARKKKRADGRLQSSFTYEGKRYYVYGRTTKELLEKEARKRKDLEEGTAQRTNPTLNSYYEHFTETRSGSVKESTIRTQLYQYQTAAAVTMDGNGKTLGEIRICDIKPRDMKNVQKALANSNRTTETVNNIMAHLKHVFNAAVRDETIDRNPCNCIANLRRTEKPARETIHRAMTIEETKKFFEAARARNSFYYNVFDLMINTGMRVGEVGALSWFDVDEKAGVIHVRRTVTRTENNAYIIGDSPKTSAGYRDIPLNPEIKKILYRQMDLLHAFFGFQSLPSIFPSIGGALLREYTINREMERCCKAAEIEKITSHAFRDTFATRFIEQRPEDYKALQEILGHEDPTITLGLYTHATEQKKQEAMNNIYIFTA